MDGCDCEGRADEEAEVVAAVGVERVEVGVEGTDIPHASGQRRSMSVTILAWLGVEEQTCAKLWQSDHSFLYASFLTGADFPRLGNNLSSLALANLGM